MGVGDLDENFLGVDIIATAVVPTVSNHDAIGSADCLPESFIGVEREQIAQTESNNKTDRKQNCAT